MFNAASTEKSPLVYQNASPPGDLECGCLDPGSGRFLLVALGAIALIVAGGLCLSAGVNAFGSIALIGAGTLIVIIDLIVWQCKSKYHHEMAKQPRYSYEPSESQGSPFSGTKRWQRKSSLNGLENDFFNQIFQDDSDLNQFWKMLVKADGSIKEKAALMVETYLVGRGEDKKVTETTKKALINHFIDQLERNEIQPTIVIFDQGKKIKVCATKGDGSCGPHALFGKEIDGVYQCDAAAYRKGLCDWVEAKQKEGNLPKKVARRLDDYFYNWDKVYKLDGYFFPCVPDELRTKENNAGYRSLYNKYENASNEREKDNIRKAFRAFILKPFLDIYLNKVGKDMYQDELQLIAKCYKTNFILVQKAWDYNGEPTNVSKKFTYGKPSDPYVYVYYNGNHYSRAYLVEQELFAPSKSLDPLI